MIFFFMGKKAHKNNVTKTDILPQILDTSQLRKTQTQSQVLALGQTIFFLSTVTLFHIPGILKSVTLKHMKQT